MVIWCINLIRGVSVSVTVFALISCSDNGEIDNRTAPQSESHYLGADQWPAIDNPVKKDAIIEAKIVDIVSRMSVEEKVGQILQPEIQYITPEDIKTYHIGSILNGGGSMPNRDKHATPKEWLDMADSFYDASMDTSDGNVAIPVIWGSDAVHGHNNVIGATLFPHNIGLGAAHNPDLIQQIGRVTAREMRVTGIDWTFAPTLAVVQNDRWGRTYESYSEDPAVVKSYAGEMVYGLQGVPGSKEFLDVNHVVATAKHFVGDGGTEGGDDQGDTKASEEELRDIHGAGYISALEAGVQTAMASFSSWNGEKLHGSKYLLTDVLKNRMGLDGLVVGDWNGHGQVPGCTNASCAASINAGVDLIMVPQDWKEMYKNTLEQVKSGEVLLERLDDAVSRILRVKIRAGLFDKGRPSERGIAGQSGIIGSADHKAVARQAVRESLVLLKNKGSILPLNPNQKILVAGDGADNIGKQSGGWTISWQGTGNVNSDFPQGTSIMAGIKDAVLNSGGEVIYSLDASYMEKPDVAIVVFGEEPYAEFQGDRDSLEFEAGNKKSLAILKKLKVDNISVVSIFLSGRPMWVNPEINASDAFVAAWLPGSEGAGIADVLIADKNGSARNDFKGRLSFSWPKTPLQDVLNPHHDNYDPLLKLGAGESYAAGGKGLANLPEDVEGVQKGNGGTVDLFVGRTSAPWEIYIDDHNTPQLLSGPYAALPSGSMSIKTADMNVQEDALEVSWSGSAYGGASISGGEALEFTEQVAANGTLIFKVKLDDLPQGDIFVSMECEQGCKQPVSLIDNLKALVGHGWQPVAISLACFKGYGGKLGKVSMPFRLEGTGKGSISFAEIKITKSSSATLTCDQ